MFRDAVEAAGRYGQDGSFDKPYLKRQDASRDADEGRDFTCVFVYGLSVDGSLSVRGL